MMKDSAILGKHTNKKVQKLQDVVLHTCFPKLDVQNNEQPLFKKCLPNTHKLGMKYATNNHCHVRSPSILKNTERDKIYRTEGTREADNPKSLDFEVKPSDISVLS